MTRTDFVPGIAVLRGYRREWLRGDVLAGVTVAAYLIPQVMAYAQIAGLPPVAGLWAILGPLAVYAVFGSSRQLSVGPESTSALMTAAGVAALVGAVGTERYAEVAAIMAIAVGILCPVGFVGRLGFLADLLSKPMLVGYMAGVAVLMIVSQLGKTTRLDVEGETLVAQGSSFVGRLGDAHVPTVIVAAACLVALFAIRRISPLLPGPLIVIVLAAAAVWAFGLTGAGITVIGEVPRGLPTPRLPHLRDLDLLALLPAALGVALVAYSDNVLTARAFAARKRERIDNNQEFLALGVANLSAGFLQGFPVSSSGSRTMLGDAVGSRTQVYSLVALLGVVTTMFLLGPALAWFPTAALGAVVVYAAIRLVDVAEMRRITRFSRMEAVLCATTTAAVLFMGLLPGTGLAVALSIVDLLRRLTRPHDGVLGYIPGMAGMHDLDDYDSGTEVPGAARVPVRRPAVLRQRRGLPRACPPGRRRRRDAPALVPAQRSGRSSPNGASRLPSPGHGSRSWRRSRRGPPGTPRAGQGVRDPTHRGGGVRPLARRAPRRGAGALRARPGSPAGLRPPTCGERRSRSAGPRRSR